MTKKFITEKELSAMTGRALQTLRNDRFKGKGFPYIKIGKSVRYDQEVVIAIMEKNKVETSSFQPESNGQGDS
jgi:hypothetical protein